MSFGEIALSLLYLVRIMQLVMYLLFLSIEISYILFQCYTAIFAQLKELKTKKKNRYDHVLVHLITSICNAN